MAKGNDGTAARQRSLRTIVPAGIVALVVTFGVVFFFGGSESNASSLFSKRLKKRHHHHGYHFDHDEGDDHRHNGHKHLGKQRKNERGGGPDDASGEEQHRLVAPRKKKNAIKQAILDIAKRQQRGDDDDSTGGGTSGGGDGDDSLAARYRKELLHGQTNRKKAEKKLELILNGSLNLVDLYSSDRIIAPASSEKGGGGVYHGVTGKFCRLDFALHKNDPSSYPMFRFLVQNSPNCNEKSMIHFDLAKVAYLARLRDRYAEEKGGSGGDDGPKVLNLTAVAFHESRCGSTLVANSMIAMDPEKHRTYSESTPPSNAFHICGRDGDRFEKCGSNGLQTAATIFRDVVYLMSRTDDHREERVFFKFQSITSKKIRVFQEAFPDVPWMYVYREPVQVIMSHYKDDPAMRRAICTKFRHSPPRDLAAIAVRHGRRGPDDLQPVEFCAAHLASLTEAAVSRLNGMAIPVAYDKLPDMLWESVMPSVFGRDLHQFEIDNMKEVSKSYSKGGKKEKKGEFKGDSEQKEERATDEVRAAAKEFLMESFHRLEDFEPELLKKQ